MVQCQSGLDKVIRSVLEKKMRCIAKIINMVRAKLQGTMRRHGIDNLQVDNLIPTFTMTLAGPISQNKYK